MSDPDLYAVQDTLQKLQDAFQAAEAAMKEASTRTGILSRALLISIQKSVSLMSDPDIYTVQAITAATGTDSALLWELVSEHAIKKTTLQSKIDTEKERLKDQVGASDV